jgi:hypothetical protein
MDQRLRSVIRAGDEVARSLLVDRQARNPRKIAHETSRGELCGAQHRSSFGKIEGHGAISRNGLKRGDSDFALHFERRGRRMGR